MYVDSYVVSSIIIVALTVVVVGYIGWFGYRHIQQDSDKAKSDSATQSDDMS